VEILKVVVREYLELGKEGIDMDYGLWIID